MRAQCEYRFLKCQTNCISISDKETGRRYIRDGQSADIPYQKGIQTKQSQNPSVLQKILPRQELELGFCNFCDFL